MIGLDFLLAPSEDEASRQSDNAELLEAIEYASEKGIPVVLPVLLERIGDTDIFKQRPIIYQKSRLNARVGFINGPADPRAIPTREDAEPPDGVTVPTPIDSFALAIVQAYEDAAALQPKAKEKKIIGQAIAERRVVFGSFVPQETFRTISAAKLWRGDANIQALCRHRIVLIGGTYHLFQGSNRFADMHLTPAGRTSGLFVQANYVEALLDDRVQFAVSERLGLLLDLFLLYLIYKLPHWVEGKVARFAIWGIMLIPIVGSYIMFANVGRYLDCEAPVIGSFFHVMWEQIEEHVISVIASVWVGLSGITIAILQWTKKSLLSGGK